MSNLTIEIKRAEFQRDSEHFNLVPVQGTVDSPSIRPLAALRVLRTPGQPAFIFESESPEQGASRYSYVCPSVDLVLRTGPTEQHGDIDPLEALRRQFSARSLPTQTLNDLPTLITGAFGYVGYESIEHFEPSVGELPPDPTSSPTAAFAFPRELLVFDHALNRLHIVVFAGNDGSYDAAIGRISEICQALESAPSTDQLTKEQFESLDPVELHPATSQPAGNLYPELVQSAREAIIDGELIQVVLGQRVETRTSADPLDIYEQLTAMNPSPFMFLLDLGDMQLIGASPELMLRSTNGKVSTHPIAGTRPRGETSEEDLLHEADLISNEKETAEHVMLVDLARNDLGRVCEPGTVRVESLKHIERYSHVMHLVSRVEGQLTPGNDGLDAFKAGFPIGTLAGAPKIRAMQLIADLEPEGRGPYCGGIGWFGANGDVDTGTVIRSIVLRNGTAHVQGGAGIVFDSEPEAENLESLQKAKAPLLAIARVEQSHVHTWRSSDQNSSKPTATTATIPAES